VLHLTKNAEDRTSFTPVGNDADRMSTWMMTGLPDDLVRLEEERRGNGKAEGLRRLEVDDQLERGPTGGKL
jgi:hypothetical protein